MKIIRMKDIAAAVGVDASTVSLALRGDPRISETVRVKVTDAAARLGYKRDPALSALAEARWRSESRGALGNWAVFTDSNEAVVREGRYRHLYRQAAARGYAMEIVRFTLQSKASRINRELRARGVRGVLITPMTNKVLVDRFDWNALGWKDFSWVALNEASYQPKVHRVLFNPFRDTRVALRSIVEMGYRRIAFIHEISNLSRVNIRQHAAGLQFAAEHPELDLQLIEAPRNNAVLTKVHKYLPEAVLLGYSQLRERLPSKWKHLPWATLTRWKRNSDEAGIFLNQEALCEEAVDLLDFLCRRRDTGIPERRKTVMLDSPWLDGATMPTISSNNKP